MFLLCGRGKPHCTASACPRLRDGAACGCSMVRTAARRAVLAKPVSSVVQTQGIPSGRNGSPAAASCHTPLLGFSFSLFQPSPSCLFCHSLATELLWVLYTGGQWTQLLGHAVSRWVTWCRCAGRTPPWPTGPAALAQGGGGPLVSGSAGSGLVATSTPVLCPRPVERLLLGLCSNPSGIVKERYSASLTFLECWFSNSF